MIKTAAVPQALQAYAAAQKRMAAGPAGGTEAAGGSQFASFLKSELQDTGTKLQASEGKAIEALGGKADLQQVVEAVTAAELGLQKVTAVRDRVIAAYQEIMRMPM